ncbi:hypothetical protein BDZ97DRAFT_1923689 [Flammula alnicola]|nr:hypothetical protein BDZ97DRAFT_1923689 [Flammula alnicola]
MRSKKQEMPKKTSKSVHKRLRDIDPARFHHTFGRLQNMRSNSRRDDAPENSLDSGDTPSPDPQSVQYEVDAYPLPPTPSGIQFDDQEATRHFLEHNAGHPSLQTPRNIVGQTISRVSSTLNGTSQAATPSTPFAHGSDYFYHAPPTSETAILVDYNDQLGRTTDEHHQPLHPPFNREAAENAHRNLPTPGRSSAEEANLFFYSSLAPSHPHPDPQPSSSAHNSSSSDESFSRYPTDVRAPQYLGMAYLSSNPYPIVFSREAAENSQQNLYTHGSSSLAPSHPHPAQQPLPSAHNSSSRLESSFPYPTDVREIRHLEMANQAAEYMPNPDLVASDGGAGNRLASSFHPHIILPANNAVFNPNGPNGGFSGNPE